MLKEALCRHLHVFTGAVFRGHDPRWSYSPESGEGAKRNGGRFNPVGIPALYTSMTQAGAWVEAQQSFRHKAQPLTICQYDVNCEKVLDLTDEDVLLACGIKPSQLGGEWIQPSKAGFIPKSWQLSNELRRYGVAAIIVPSYANEASVDMRNIVFFDWSNMPPNKVSVIDDENRLPKRS